MDTRKTTAEFRMSQWAKIIQSRIDSGLSIKDFCQTNGISKNAFFYWQKKLREKACTEIEVAEKTRSIVVGCKNYISQIKMLIYSKQNKYNYADFEQYDKRISTQEAGILFIACETELMQIAKVQK